MPFSIRLALCLLCPLALLSGCKPFQPGSLSRLQQPLPTSDGGARLGLGPGRARSARLFQADAGGSDFAVRKMEQPSEKVALLNMGDTPWEQHTGALVSRGLATDEHALEGPCASCGIDHGESSRGNSGPVRFKFSQPLPEYQPPSHAAASPPSTATPEAGDLGSSEAGLSPASAVSFAQPIRIHPGQLEEARTDRALPARATAAQPAPPPQPDDSPAPGERTAQPASGRESRSAEPQPQASTFTTASPSSPPAGASTPQIPGGSEPAAASSAAARSEPAVTTTSPGPVSKTAHPPSATNARLSAGRSDSDGVARVKLTATTEASPAANGAENQIAPTGTAVRPIADQSATFPGCNPAALIAARLAELQADLQAIRAEAAERSGIVTESETTAGNAAAEALADPLWGEHLESELTALELIAARVAGLAAGEVEASESQQACRHQLAALVGTLRPDSFNISSPAGRTAAAATLEHLRAAIAEVELLMSLKVTRGALCSEVRGFGQYEAFPESGLRVGQTVLLYCELENFHSASRANAGGVTEYSTRLQSSLVICRADGSVAQQAEFPVVEDVARNRRRDFYLYVPFTLGELPAGKYRAHLLVDDLLGRKQAVLDPPVEFTVR